MTHDAQGALQFRAACAGRKDDAVDAATGEMLAYLSGLHRLLKQLADLSDAKLAAMRKADAAALEQCAADEEATLREIFQAAQGRAAVLARLAQTLHCPELRAARLSAIAEHLPEPHASALRARIAALTHCSDELQRKNRIAAKVAHNLQDHLRAVFAVFANATQESNGYGPQGQPEMNRTRAWVDAVG